MFNLLYDASLLALYSVAIILMVGAAELGVWVRRRVRRGATGEGDIGTLASAQLGLLALLIGFSFSLALSRYDLRRGLVLEEANAIGSTANFALMLPDQAQAPILALLREYTAVRIGLGIPFDPAKLERDVAKSIEIQNKLWRLAMGVTATAPQSLPAYRFVGSLNEINNIHESRLMALRYHVPAPVTFMLVGLAMVAMGFTGYHLGSSNARGRIATLIMSLTVAVVIMVVVDLNRPARGLIQVPVEALVDAGQGIPR